MNNSKIPFHWAEVIKTVDTYQYVDTDDNDTNREYLYTIEARLYDDDNQSYPIVAKPYDLNNIKIPLKGEHVIVFTAISPGGNREIFDRRTQWYYMNPISINSNINQNALPGISIENTADETIHRPISPKQIFKGDNVLQGRFGNTIRLGSTISSNERNLYFKSPPWRGQENDPIIIISNSNRNSNNNQLETEDFNDDYSTLCLTSTQELSGYTVTKSLKQENQYQSQFIGIADRINLAAKTDSVTINAPNNIELNTDKVVFGTSNIKEPGIQSTQLIEVLNNILNVLSSGFKTVDNTIITSAFDQTSLQTAYLKMNTIENRKIQQDKRFI